ncbi:MAG: DUF2252 family protein, partial [Acidimicrobiales bacterium]
MSAKKATATGSGKARGAADPSASSSRSGKSPKSAKLGKSSKAKQTKPKTSVPVSDEVMATAENMQVAALMAERQMAKTGPVQRPERLEAGKALRQKVPRAWHAAWEPAPDRRDPIAILEAQAETRLPDLIPIRHGRMVSSPFAFFRGAAAVMAADLATTPDTGIQVQACGDAHL